MITRAIGSSAIAHRANNAGNHSRFVNKPASTMSPEQVGGDRLDRRTDLFSLGVVLYECVTGQQPFQGKTSAVILASILTQQPKPPIELNSSIPIGLQDAISACLEKDRELRYQDAGSLRADLKRVKRDLDSGALGVMIVQIVQTARRFTS